MKLPACARQAVLAPCSSSQAGGSRDLVAAREGRANATRRRARGRRASSRCSITQSARLPSARRRSRRPRKHEISTSPRSTRGTRGAPGARQSPAARRACIQKQRAAQIRHLKQLDSKVSCSLPQVLWRARKDNGDRWDHGELLFLCLCPAQGIKPGDFCCWFPSSISLS